MSAFSCASCVPFFYVGEGSSTETVRRWPFPFRRYLESDTRDAQLPRWAVVHGDVSCTRLLQCRIMYDTRKQHKVQRWCQHRMLSSKKTMTWVANTELRVVWRCQLHILHSLGQTTSVAYAQLQVPGKCSNLTSCCKCKTQGARFRQMRIRNSRHKSFSVVHGLLRVHSDVSDPYEEQSAAILSI